MVNPYGQESENALEIDLPSGLLLMKIGSGCRCLRAEVIGTNG